MSYSGRLEGNDIRETASGWQWNKPKSRDLCWLLVQFYFLRKCLPSFWGIIFLCFFQLSPAKSAPKILTKVQKCKSLSMTPLPGLLIPGSWTCFPICWITVYGKNSLLICSQLHSQCLHPGLYFKLSGAWKTSENSGRCGFFLIKWGITSWTCVLNHIYMCVFFKYFNQIYLKQVSFIIGKNKDYFFMLSEMTKFPNCLQRSDRGSDWECQVHECLCSCDLPHMVNSSY